VGHTATEHGSIESFLFSAGAVVVVVVVIIFHGAGYYLKS
jgi:hypothetical protein